MLVFIGASTVLIFHMKATNRQRQTDNLSSVIQQLSQSAAVLGSGNGK